jgi:hypothetical protein
MEDFYDNSCDAIDAKNVGVKFGRPVSNVEYNIIPTSMDI